MGSEMCIRDSSLSQNPKTVTNCENDANGFSGEEVLLDFPRVFIPQLKKIETAEHILNELDERFSFNCQFLVWDADKINIVELSDFTSEYKNATIKFESPDHPLPEKSSKYEVYPTISFLLLLKQRDGYLPARISVTVN